MTSPVGDPEENDVKSPASKFGALIGYEFEAVVLDYVAQYLRDQHSDYVLLEAEEGKKLITLPMIGGLSRQMDNVIMLRDSDDPVALLETKWLKDARHHNDKGAWILQLREVRKKHPTIRGATAVLSGFWTEGVGLMLLNEGGVKMVLVATDEQVYKTFQEPLNRFLGADTFELIPVQMRKSYVRPQDLMNLIIHLRDNGELRRIAESWLGFERLRDEQQNVLTGGDLIKRAIDELLTPIEPQSNIRKFEIALQIAAGNTIYAEFSDFEEARQFLEEYGTNPARVIDKITPKKRRDHKKDDD